MRPSPVSYERHRFPRQIIAHSIWYEAARGLDADRRPKASKIGVPQESNPGACSHDSSLEISETDDQLAEVAAAREFVVGGLRLVERKSPIDHRPDTMVS